VRLQSQADRLGIDPAPTEVGLTGSPKIPGKTDEGERLKTYGGDCIRPFTLFIREKERNTEPPFLDNSLGEEFALQTLRSGTLHIPWEAGTPAAASLVSADEPGEPRLESRPPGGLCR
jgi:hypothetical protein